MNSKTDQLASIPQQEQFTVPEESYKYLVHFLNSSEKKTKTVTRIWHDVHGKFKHAKELEDQLVSSFEDKLGSLCDLECGYMEKNLKGGLRMTRTSR